MNLMPIVLVDAHKRRDDIILCMEIKESNHFLMSKCLFNTLDSNLNSNLMSNYFFNTLDSNPI